MDLTQIFKASVKAVKLRRNKTTVEDKNRILKPKNKNNGFSTIAKNVRNKITELRNLLIENRAAYMRFAQHLKNSRHMTDEQRNIIDRETEKIVNYYTQQLDLMKSDWITSKLKKQNKEHIQNVIELLINYLKAVQNLHSEQRKYRVKHELQTYRYLKLADKKSIPIRLGDSITRKTNSDYNNDDDDTDEGFISKDDNQDDNFDTNSKENEWNYKSEQDLVKQKDKLLSTQQFAMDDDLHKLQQQQYDNELSPEEIQMYEEENNQLYQQLQGLNEEVEQIEKNVVDIARLQEVFTEKVTLQQHDIERIANVVVGATENVKDANEQIKQAIQRNAGLRVWTLFFLLVMSFSLLFLDWYND